MIKKRYRADRSRHRAIRCSARALAAGILALAALSSEGESPLPLVTYALPLVTPASNIERVGFVRIINHSDHAGEVSITAIDDNGQRFGPVSLSLEALAAVHFNSKDLENGNASKGLSGGGVGDGTGNWRLELTTTLEIEPLAYIRTSDGFVTNMHEMAAETQEGSNRYQVPFFNPGKNENQVSSLRLINPGSADASIEITGVDDEGRAPSGAVRLTLGAGMARMLSARELEDGTSGTSGRLGAGAGKWRLSVSADRPIQMMSLLELPTGHLTNLSRGWEGVFIEAPPPPPPPPSGLYDGAIAAGWHGDYCGDNSFDWVAELNYYNDSPVFGPETEAYYACENLGLLDCEVYTTFRYCGALAYGELTASECEIFGSDGPTKAEAEAKALAMCWNRWSFVPDLVVYCGIVASYCNE